LATVVTTTAAERRKRSRLKRIVVSERNYLALKMLGHAGDSFNDVISKLLRIQRNYQEKQQQLQMQQQESDDENNSTNSSGLPFPGSLSELFDEQDRQQLADLLRLRRGNRSSRNNQQSSKKPNR
jgi:predicted CopG family antitoxin